MTAHEYHLVGFLRAPQLAHEVRRGCVIEETRVHLEPQHDLLSPFRHPAEAVGVFSRDRGGRNLWRAFLVPHAPGVRRPQTGQTHGPDQSRHRSRFGRGGGAAAAVAHGFAVGRVRDVEQDDSTPRLILPRVQLIE
jgi:hypothetical protein